MTVKAARVQAEEDTAVGVVRPWRTSVTLGWVIVLNEMLRVFPAIV